MKKMSMMTSILGSLNTVVQWGKRMKNKRMKNKNLKKRHHMSPMMSFAVSLLMHREDAKVKGEVEVQSHVRGSTKRVVPRLQRGKHKARCRTGIIAMEGRVWYT